MKPPKYDFRLSVLEYLFYIAVAAFLTSKSQLKLSERWKETSLGVSSVFKSDETRLVVELQ
jgi:hypothetical protein